MFFFSRCELVVMELLFTRFSYFVHLFDSCTLWNWVIIPCGFFFLIIGVCLNFFLILLESFVEIAIKTVFHCELAVMGLPFLLIVLFAIG